MKITIFPSKYHQNGGFFMAMLVSGRVNKSLFANETNGLGTLGIWRHGWRKIEMNQVGLITWSTKSKSGSTDYFFEDLNSTHNIPSCPHIMYIDLVSLYICLVFIHLSYSSKPIPMSWTTHIWPRLEKLLKDAILHGAKLGRSKKDLEEQLAQQKVEQGRLQRRVMQLTQEVVFADWLVPKDAKMMRDMSNFTEKWTKMV